MVVTMISMGVMQMTVDKIVDMVAVRNWLVSATRSVNMAAVVPGAGVARGASVWVNIRDLQCMLLNGTIGIHVVQVAIVQIIDMIAMLHRGVSAIGTVLVIMIFVNVSHRIVP
jgi:hypothetical protein